MIRLQDCVEEISSDKDEEISALTKELFTISLRNRKLRSTLSEKDRDISKLRSSLLNYKDCLQEALSDKYRETLVLEERLYNITLRNSRLQDALFHKDREILALKDKLVNVTNTSLIKIPYTDEEYWNVNHLLQKDMPDAHISVLWRVVNANIWMNYCDTKRQLEFRRVPPNERLAWHGTSMIDPEVIYRDVPDGFMIQRAGPGQYGRGIYFAAKSACSDLYAHRPAKAKNMNHFRLVANDDEKEIFLAKLLVGKEIVLTDSQPDMVLPPKIPETNLRYNTVAANLTWKSNKNRSMKSPIWVVYENGRAYPEYLVRYYRGKRDSKRTPCQSMMKMKLGLKNLPLR